MDPTKLPYELPGNEISAVSHGRTYCAMILWHSNIILGLPYGAPGADLLGPVPT